MSSYEQDIEESLRILFSTSPGERVNRYDYGCPCAAMYSSRSRR